MLGMFLHWPFILFKLFYVAFLHFICFRYLLFYIEDVINEANVGNIDAQYDCYGFSKCLLVGGK